MDLNLFSKKKERIKLNYEEMLEVARILGLNDIEKNIIDSIESLMKDSFNIVVVGEFSRGKSTFINALVGKRILPSATNLRQLLSIKYLLVTRLNISCLSEMRIKRLLYLKKSLKSSSHQLNLILRMRLSGRNTMII